MQFDNHFFTVIGSYRFSHGGVWMQFDFFRSTLCHPRADRLIQAAFDGARSLDSIWMSHEPRQDAYVVLYGLGGIDRVRFASRDRLIAFDAGYWNRKGADRSFRVSVGGFHCPQVIMEGPRPGSERWNASGLAIRQAGNASGPILLVGNGPKSNLVGASGWTAAKSAELRRTFPGRRVLYRPKPNKPIEHGIDHDGTAEGHIDDVLQDVSLVVCRHSNVAVDACRLGVPVVCDDGAASAIYPQKLVDCEMQPSAALREEFLHRLAWWQWQVAEFRNGMFWDWMTEVLRAIH